MTITTPLLAALLLVASVPMARTALASEDVLSRQVTSDSLPSVQMNQETSALRRVALALSTGSEAMGTLRGSPSEEDEKDRLKPPIPGMDCGVDRLVSYVSCYSAIIDSEQEGGNLFTRLVDELQAALPSDSWIKVNKTPGIDSIRSFIYEDQKSEAHIDIDLIARPEPEGEYSYMVTILGWPATDPRL